MYDCIQKNQGIAGFDGPTSYTCMNYDYACMDQANKAHLAVFHSAHDLDVVFAAFEFISKAERVGYFDNDLKWCRPFAEGDARKQAPRPQKHR